MSHYLRVIVIVLLTYCFGPFSCDAQVLEKSFLADLANKISRDSCNFNRLIGSKYTDQAYGVTQTADDGFVIVGHVWSLDSSIVVDANLGEYHIWIIKLDSSGKFVWDKRIGGDGTESVSSVIALDDGGIVILGSSNSSRNGDVSDVSNGKTDIWVVKMDSKGLILWNKLLGGEYIDMGHELTLASDESIVLIGSAYVVNRNEYFVLKMDLSGNSIWKKRLSERNSYNSMSIIPMSNGDILIAGMSRLTGELIKFDKEGEMIWQKSIGRKRLNVQYSIKSSVSSNGDIVLAGYSSPQRWSEEDESVNDLNMWVTKLDASGNLMWDRLYGGDRQDVAMSMAKLDGGGYILAGSSGSSNSKDVSGINSGYSDCWIVKIDENGNVIWDKLVGGDGIDSGESVITTSSGDIIIVGYSDSGKSNFTNDHSTGRSDYMVLKLDSLSNLKK